MTAQEQILEAAEDILSGSPRFKGALREVNNAIFIIRETKELEEDVLPAFVNRQIEDISYVGEFFEKDEFNAQTILTKTIRKTNDFANAVEIAEKVGDNFELLAETRKVLVNADWFKFKQDTRGTFPTPTAIKTKLTAEQQLEVRSLKFRAWFGNWVKAARTGNYDGVSKLIDPATKEPMLCFHGTGYDGSPFTMFRTDLTMTPGIYVSDDYDYAKWFADFNAKRGDRAKGGATPIVYPCFVQMLNPIDFRVVGLQKLNKQQLQDVIYVLTGYENSYPALDARSDTDEYYVWQWFRAIPEMLADFRKNTEFDGVIFEAFNPSYTVDKTYKQGLEILAFYPEQVKLPDAVFFSGLVEDVRFEKGGTV